MRKCTFTKRKSIGALVLIFGGSEHHCGITKKPPNPYEVVPLGDKAVLVDLCDRVDLEANVQIQRLAKAIQLRGLPWILDVVPALGSLAIHINRHKIDRTTSPVHRVQELIGESLSVGLPDLDLLTRTVELPVCYDREFGLDIEEVAEHCSVSVQDVERLHTGSLHRVLMVGFVPGHPYIGGLDPSLLVPRRPTPRRQVSAGSIAIANAQTVVYPFASPSGWSIIGRTTERIFDPSWLPPALFSPGDRVKFISITREEYERSLQGQQG